MNIPDNYDYFKQHEAEQAAWLGKLPECSECGEKIQDEYCYEVNGEFICEQCMKDNHRKSTENIFQEGTRLVKTNINPYLKEKAKADYLKLVEETNAFVGTFEEFYKKMNGFNYQGDYESFDLNYGCLTATIYEENGVKIVYEYIDIWDDEQEKPIVECIHYASIF